MILQKLAEISTIGLFLLTIYTTFSGKLGLPLLLAQRYSSLLLVLFSLCLIVALFSRKHSSKVITLEGTLELIKGHSGGAGVGSYPPKPSFEAEVFYPQPFKHTPYLTINFPKIADLEELSSCGMIGPSHPLQLEYRITEQKPDKFKLEVFSLGYYKPIIKWQAKGKLEVKEKKSPRGRRERP